MNHVLMLCLLFCILFTYIFINGNKKQLSIQSHIHDNELYPEMKYIFDNRSIIQQEFFNNIK